MTPFSIGLGAATVLAATITVIVRGVFKFYETRSRVNRLRKLGLPMPPWSWIFGHLSYLRSYLARYPSDVFVPVAFGDMSRDFSETDMFYIDLWPFASSYLIVNDPDAAMAVSSAKPPFPKAQHFKDMIDPIVGGPNMITANGAEWKLWRNVFNPAFSMANLMEQVPSIVDSARMFCQKLEERAQKGTVLPLEDIATRLTMDIIIKVVMDQNSDYQLKGNPLADSLRSMVNWSNFGNPFLHLHPIRPFAIKYYNEIMDMYVRRAVNLRFEEVRREAIEAKRHQSKSILALALRDYMKERETTDLSDITLDTAYAKAVASQLRLFLFAGHDTTTSILVYTYHALHKNPDALQRLQDEHTAVFGSDTESCDKLLAAEPHLINQLHYTTAVIKETMRMHPPAGAERAGVPGVALYDRYNAAYPTKGVTLSIQHSGLHHHPRLWPRVNEFLPERWLVEEGHELYPRHGAFRVFEHGARNCIGQNLSMIELKVVLVMTVRKFKIQPAYEEWDELRPIGWKERLFGRRKVASLNGERAYQVEKGAAHPKDGYPCRVSRVNA